MNKIISLLSLIGIAVATYLSKVYYSIHSGTASFKSFCNLGAAFNCDFVSSTKYATFLPGIPLSSLVIGWYLSLFILSILTEYLDSTEEQKQNSLRIGFYMSLISSLYSVGLIFVMAFVLKTFCLFCLVIDVLNFLILFLFFKSLKKPLFKFPSSLSKISGIIAVSFFLALVLTKSNFDSGSDKMSDTDLDYMVNQISTSPVETFSLPTGVAFLGNENAKITILELSDFQCPHCQKGAFLINSLLTLYPKDIKIGFLHFPLDSACNRLMKGSMHPVACELARGAICAEQNKKFKEYYEGIFENQESLNGSSATAMLTELGVSNESVKNCLDNNDIKKSVSDHIEFGILHKVESTPTFFFNGHKVEGVLPLEVWKRLIEKELK